MNRKVRQMSGILSMVVVTTALFGQQTEQDEPETLAEAVAWMEEASLRIIRASRRTMADGTAAFPPQVGSGYEAFWLRDYVYTLEGSIDAYSDEELMDAGMLFIRGLRSDGAAVDCVKFDGTPIYKPGYGTMGDNPVADGSQFTVSVAWHTYKRTKDLEFLRGMIELLVKTMNAVPRNADTHLVHIDPKAEWDRCPYGFTDTIRKKGDVLFSSLLYVQAGQRLSELLLAADRRPDADHWRHEAEEVAESVRKVFWDPETGLFRAATVFCREHDIWGSAFAVYLGVADEEQSEAVAAYFKKNYAELVHKGQIRHLPGGIYWEKGCERDTYQNGAYWATPVGWFVFTLDLADPALADRTVIELVDDFKREGICEWIFGETRELPGYLASASAPLAGIRAMIERRKGR